MTGDQCRRGARFLNPKDKKKKKVYDRRGGTES